MDEKEITIVTKDVILSSVYYRLLCSKKTIEDEIAKRQILTPKNNPNIFEKAASKVSKYIKDNEVEALQKDLKSLEATIDTFKKDHENDDNIYMYAENIEEFKAIINDLLANDKNNKLRYQIALLAALESNRYKHTFSDKTLDSLSILFFNDKTIIKKLVKKYEGYLNSLKLDKRAFTVACITFMFAFVISAIAISFGCPFCPNLAQILANLGHAAPKLWFKGMIIASTASATAAFFAAFSASHVFNKGALNDIKEFRSHLKSVDKKQFISQYAVELTILDAIKDTSDELALKEYKDNLLQNISTAREEMEYLFVIESDKEGELKDKLFICNNVIDCLAKLTKKPVKE